jgi:hypothetical protein
MNDNEITNISVGINIRTKVEFSGVPKGTTGKVIEDLTPGRNHKEKEYAIQWGLVRTKPLVDWFTESEFRDFLEVLE